jgi:hypothetical protein
VMDEKLSVHEEERNVVNAPDEHEESGVIPESIAHSYREGLWSLVN